MTVLCKRCSTNLCDIVAQIATVSNLPCNSSVVTRLPVRGNAVPNMR